MPPNGKNNKPEFVIFPLNNELEFVIFAFPAKTGLFASCRQQNNELEFVIFRVNNELQFVFSAPGVMNVCEWDDTTQHHWGGVWLGFSILLALGGGARAVLFVTPVRGVVNPVSMGGR